MKTENKNNLIKKINENKKIVVMVGATWCGECVMTKPIFERVSNNEKFNSIEFFYIDVDEFELWSDDGDSFFSINEVPTIVVFENSKEIKRVTNFISENKLIDFLI